MTAGTFRRMGLLATSLAALQFAGIACSSSNSGSDAGSMTTDGGSSMTGTDGGSSMTGTDGGSGTPDAGTPATTNHSFNSAKDIQVDGATLKTKLMSVSTPDYYKFTAKAGDRLTAAAIAQGLVSSSDGNDPSIVDTVITVFDSTQNQIAQDDDDWPRTGTDSQLFFIPPADGDYYLRIDSCISLFGAQNCTPASMVKVLNYDLILAHAANIETEANAGTSQDGTTAKAVTVPYMVPQGGKTGEYGEDVIDGLFPSLNATQVFSFTPPADTAVPSGETVIADFWAQPKSYKNGDGSTANVKMWVTDSSGEKVIAKVDQSNYADGDNFTNPPVDMSVPVTPGSQYYLFVQNGASFSSPTTDYYFIQHAEGANLSTPEAEAANMSGTNDTPATAQVLATPMNLTPGVYLVEGNIGASGDVDWFEVDPPSGAKTAGLSCAGQRAGSGVRGLTVGLYTLDSSMNPTAISGTTGTEAANMDFAPTGMTGATVPGNATKVYLQVSATGQDSTVTGTFYNCQVFYQ